MPGSDMEEGEWRPKTDPTVLTTEALHREVGILRALIEERFSATDLLVAEKFFGVSRQLDLVERQRVEQKSDTKAAVDAALTAQKEAVKEQTLASEKAIQKSESSIKEQLSQITVTFSTALQGLTAALDDLKERVSKVESTRLGNKEATTGFNAMLAILITAAIMVVGVISLVTR